MKSIWKIVRKTIIGLAVLGGGLLLAAAAGIVWIFCLASQSEKDVVTCKDAISYVQQADRAANPDEKLQNLHAAVAAYLAASDIKQSDAIQRIMELLPRMQENKLAPEAPARYLFNLLDEPAALSVFVQSGLFDFSAKLDEMGKLDSAELLYAMMKIVALERHGERVDAFKPLIIHLLQQGTRPDWFERDAVFMPTPTDPVLVAVYTRDADFLRAVLACGLPASGINGDKKPECEALWQNSPDLVEILQSN